MHDAIKISENPDRNILNLIRMGRINYIINTMEPHKGTSSTDGFLIRRVAAENSISCFTSLGYGLRDPRRRRIDELYRHQHE